MDDGDLRTPRTLSWEYVSEQGLKNVGKNTIVMSFALDTL